MMYRALALALFLFLFPSVIFAQPEAPDKKNSKAKKAKKIEVVGDTNISDKVMSPDQTLDDSSAAMRQNKKFSFALQPLGFTVAPLVSMGFSAGYYLNPDAILELDYSQGAQNMLFFEIYGTTYDLRVKKFWGNSFYTNLGLGSRKIGVRDAFDSLTSNIITYEIDLSATSTVVDFAIGNRWQWDYFTLGCDWIGVMAPLSSKSSINNTFVDDVDSSSRKDMEDALDRLGKLPTYQLLRFYLGISL